MAVLRNKLKERYSQIPNQAIEDTNISSPAFRVLCYLFSRPDNWKINNTDIRRRLAIKRQETLSGYWKELEQTGYITRHEREREAGKFAGFDFELNPYPTAPGSTVHGGDGPGRDGPVEDRNGTNSTLSKTNQYNKTDISKRKQKFAERLKPHLPKYGRDMIKDFFGYWTEKNNQGQKMRFEYAKNQPFDISRRLATWSKNDKAWKEERDRKSGDKPTTTDQLEMYLSK